MNWKEWIRGFIDDYDSRTEEECKRASIRAKINEARIRVFEALQLERALDAIECITEWRKVGLATITNVEMSSIEVSSVLDDHLKVIPGTREITMVVTDFPWEEDDLARPGNRRWYIIPADLP